MRKWTHLFLAAVLALAATTAHAQISQEIVNIMKKSQAVLDNPSGVEMVMSIRSGMGPISMTTNMTTYSKGDKSLILMSMKILGREVKTEVGCDGTQVWKYKSRIKTKDVDRRDTLFISPAKKGNKISGGNEIDFNLHEEYRKAMKSPSLSRRTRKCPRKASCAFARTTTTSMRWNPSKVA